MSSRRLRQGRRRAGRIAGAGNDEQVRALAAMCETLTALLLQKNIVAPPEVTLELARLKLSMAP